MVTRWCRNPFQRLQADRPEKPLTVQVCRFLPVYSGLQWLTLLRSKGVFEGCSWLLVICFWDGAILSWELPLFQGIYVYRINRKPCDGIFLHLNFNEEANGIRVFKYSIAMLQSGFQSFSLIFSHPFLFFVKFSCRHRQLRKARVQLCNVSYIGCRQCNVPSVQGSKRFQESEVPVVQVHAKQRAKRVECFFVSFFVS